jgi:hypothetical protein
VTVGRMQVHGGVGRSVRVHGQGVAREHAAETAQSGRLCAEKDGERCQPRPSTEHRGALHAPMPLMPGALALVSSSASPPEDPPPAVGAASLTRRHDRGSMRGAAREDASVAVGPRDAAGYPPSTEGHTARVFIRLTTEGKPLG